MTGRITHNQRVLDLLADGEPHSHLELYALHVVAHSRVAELRARGHRIDCWLEDGLHWYRLLDEPHASGPPTSPVGLVEQTDGQICFEVAA